MAIFVLAGLPQISPLHGKKYKLARNTLSLIVIVFMWSWPNQADFHSPSCFPLKSLQSHLGPEADFFLDPILPSYLHSLWTPSNFRMDSDFPPSYEPFQCLFLVISVPLCQSQLPRNTFYLGPSLTILGRDSGG